MKFPYDAPTARAKFDAVMAASSVPAVGAPLFIVSNPALVIAQCKAGVVGSFPSLNARPGHVLHEWLDEITTELAEHDERHPDSPSAPFAINQIVHGTNDRLMHDLEATVRFEVPIVICSLGARKEVYDAVHAYGGICLHDVIDDRFARKAIGKGADGLIAVAAGAGGHAGTISPIALIQEIRAWFDGPLLLSGSIATGRAILAARAMGADAGYIGSAFIATEEANASGDYKRGIVEGGMEDIVYSSLFTGVHGNYLRASIEAAGMDPDALPEGDPSNMSFKSGGKGEAKAWKDIWGCGQGIGAVEEIRGAGDYVAELVAEYDAAKEALVA